VSEEQAQQQRSRRKSGSRVVSDAMDKTVLVSDRSQDPPSALQEDHRAGLEAGRARREQRGARGDTVRVMGTRPLSKTKRWRIVEIVERRK